MESLKDTHIISEKILFKKINEYRELITRSIPNIKSAQLNPNSVEHIIFRPYNGNNKKANNECTKLS